jgi:hypothetical protein
LAGVAFSVVAQRARLPVSARPGWLPAGTHPIDAIDLTAIIFQGGFQLGI